MVLSTHTETIEECVSSWHGDIYRDRWMQRSRAMHASAVQVLPYLICMGLEASAKLQCAVPHLKARKEKTMVNEICMWSLVFTCL